MFTSPPARASDVIKAHSLIGLKGKAHSADATQSINFTNWRVSITAKKYEKICMLVLMASALC